MLLTLRNSTDKLQALLARLGRYGAHGGEALQPVALDELLRRVAARARAAQHEVVVVERVPCDGAGRPEALEQALVHLVQNAIEASAPKDAGVPRLAACEEPHAIVEDHRFGQRHEPRIRPHPAVQAVPFVQARRVRASARSRRASWSAAMGGRLDVEVARGARNALPASACRSPKRRGGDPLDPIAQTEAGIMAGAQAQAADRRGRPGPAGAAQMGLTTISR